MTDAVSKKLSAVKFRNLLIALAVIMLVISGVGFWFFYSYLTSYAAEVQSSKNAATLSSSDLDRINELDKKMQEDKVAVERAKSIVGDSKYYKYQDQIIADITAYANASGVSISSISFDSDAAGAAKTAPAPSAVAAPQGLKSTSASIALNNPVDYKALMRFVHAIEQNLTKMQITGLSLQRDKDLSKISTNPLTVEVYTR